MSRVHLFSERVSPNGNLKAEGVRNQLGRPRLHPLAVLAREATQNCWDAKRPDRDAISVDWTLQRMTGQPRTILDDLVFRERPEAGIDFDSALNGDDLDLLLISDRETTGLCGPTRADLVTDETQDFVDFLRNVGSPPDKSMGGGTFGYGKAALYAMSRLRTILVYTRCRHEGRLESRFIGAALGDSHQIRGVPYTGRHWWGRPTSDSVDPLLDTEADELAAALGFPGFTGDGTGTTIAIVALRHWEDVPRDQFAGVLAESLLWNLWPKMLPNEQGIVPIRFRIAVDGQPVHLPRPEDWPPLNAYVAAMDFLRANRAGRPAFPHLRKALEIKVRKKTMGWLGHATEQVEQRRRLHTCTELSLGGPASTERSHHIALMRSAELVVQYQDAPAGPLDLWEHGNVFVVEPEVEVDRSFASSEPPTHDEWVVQNLTRALDRTRVRTTLKRVEKAVKDWVQPKEARPAHGADVPLGALASTLGGLLTGLPGPGSTAPRPKRASNKKRRGPRVEELEPSGLPFETPGTDSDATGEAAPPNVNGLGLLPGGSGGDRHSASGTVNTPAEGEQPVRQIRVGRPRLLVEDAHLDIVDAVGVLVVPFSVKHGRNSIGTVVSADVAVELFDGSREDSPPSGAETPRVLGWRDSDGHLHPEEMLQISTMAKVDWSLVVAVVDDANVQATLSAAALQPGGTE